MPSLPTRKVVPAFIWLFVSLAMVALLSQPGSTHDEWYHARSIWCGHGERSPYCTSIVSVNDIPIYAITNIREQNCQRVPEAPLLCPRSQLQLSSLTVNNGFLYPKLFYFVMSWLVVPSVEMSVALIRWANALIITTLLGLMIWLLPARYRLVQFLVILTTFTVSGYVLTASLQPSSWTMIGVGFGWLPIHAAIAPNKMSLQRKIALGLLGVTTWVMAVGSRHDALPMITFTLTLTSLHLAMLHFPTRKKEIVVVGLVGTVVLVWTLELFSMISVLAAISSLFTYSDGQPDNVAFFSHYLLQGLPNAFTALGRLPTMTPVWLPEIVYQANLFVLGALIFHSYCRHSQLQRLGSIAAVAVISLVIMAQVSMVDNRDPFGVEPRYSFPLLVFVVGWWFTTGPRDLKGRIANHLMAMTVVFVGMFAITMFTLAERHVDRTTWGLRLLPEGPDHWWWSRMPIGPNVVLIVAVVAMWKFLRQMSEVIEADEVAAPELTS